MLLFSGRVPFHHQAGDIQSLFPRPIRFRRAGFTLFEILAVLMVMAVLAGFSLPALIGVMGSRSLKVAAREVSNVLVLARTQAIARHTLVRFVVVDSWPGEQGLPRSRYALWIWDEGAEDFELLSEWERLPTGLFFEPSMPAYALRSSYAMRDANTVYGDYLLGRGEAKFVRSFEGRAVSMDFIDFLPTGAARLQQGEKYRAMVVFSEGIDDPSGVGVVYTNPDETRGGPGNWVQMNIEKLTGRVQIYQR
ncbi:MAG: Tfp pilus assembly protein FimT/FimU [Verrucomicrobiales bacterium]